MKKEIAKKSTGYSSLLVIECDSYKLMSQQLSIAPIIDKIFSDFKLKKYKFIPINTKNDWLSCFADLENEKQTYDVVVLIGHSNESMIMISEADNFTIEWGTTPQYLNKTVKPKCLMLIACDAGRFLPSKALFDGLPTLKKLYGSPIITSREQFYVLIIELLCILPNAPIESLFKDIINLLNTPDQEQINILLLKILPSLFSNNDVKNRDSIMTSINYFKNGGIVLKHTRNGYEKNKVLEELSLYKLLDLFYKKFIN